MTLHERHPAIRSRCIGGAPPRPARPVIPPRKLHVGLDPCLLVPVTDLDKRCETKISNKISNKKDEISNRLDLLYVPVWD